MDPNPPNQNPEPENRPSQEEMTTLPSKPPSLLLLSTASLSLSLSSLLSPSPPKPLSPHFYLPPPSFKPKIPSQISTVASHLTLSSKPSKPHLRSSSSTTTTPTISASPFSIPRRPLPDPSNPFGLRRASVVLFRSDLRLHDNETLSAAHADSLSLLPLFCFDPRDFGKSVSGFDRTGPYRSSFLIESVADLRRSLQSRGSDLIVRIGRPESVIIELAKAVGAEAVYLQREVSRDEVRTEERIEAAMKEEGVEVKYFWGSTLYHLDDLPFKLEEMPSNYGGFKERVKGLEVRKAIKALDQLKGLPARGNVEVGEIPSLTDLGLTPPSTMTQDGKPAANASLVGGETEALQKLQKFAAECRAQPNKGIEDGGRDNIYGANFSCKISPWLAMGCLSPRYMFEELKKSATRMIPGGSTQKNGTGRIDNGMNWLMYELLWRDFFRFITKKYSSTKKKLDATPATACTGAVA
ncbi:blue-light photoreceptor PHR2 [Cinnamomum micranthum f. kanehirae]|uniref:Blue-light photoreceptor PHR2 n=1 Tax=Cinnamomum micranthum f. kanehirae TaxID=337451 RepID=A0A3S3PMW3_9MAGN|nr:blue-light photoreceptor PHR2 [Cinnamomum micranthum f. kanehirae]